MSVIDQSYVQHAQIPLNKVRAINKPVSCDDEIEAVIVMSTIWWWHGHKLTHRSQPVHGRVSCHQIANCSTWAWWSSFSSCELYLTTYRTRLRPNVSLTLRLAASRPIRRENVKSGLMRSAINRQSRTVRYRVHAPSLSDHGEPRPRNRIHKNTDPCPSAVQKQMIQPLYPISARSPFAHIQTYLW